jgi:CIC family chloride channel protein
MTTRPIRSTVKRLAWQLRELSRRGPVMGDTQRFLLLSIIIGIFAGLVVVCFHISIEFFNWRTVHGLGHRAWWAVALWPALGGLASYALAYYLFPTARGSGVNYTKAALYVSDGYVPFSGVTGKFLCSTVSIGTGNPMGPEDPALQMGAGIASLLGRLFRLTREHMRLIAPVGAAAGIGAAFNTPITAVLFVMEEVVAAWSAGVMGSIVLAAVSAVVVSRWFLGDEPLYSVPDFVLTDYRELIVYALVGVVSGYLSAWFTKLVTRVRSQAKSLPRGKAFALPLLAGFVVGIAGTWIPEILGAGYGAIDSAMHDRYIWHFLLLLGGLKMVSTALCLAAGTPGGMFAPALFIGAMIGGGLGGLAHEYWPFATSSAGAYVLVGIGTFFAGLFRAPMTSIFMVFEISANYVIILPVMIANTISFLVSRSLQHESLFHVLGRQDGFDLPSVEEQREALPLSVEDAMRPGGAIVMPGSMRVAESYERLRTKNVDHCLISVYSKGWFWAKKGDLEKAIEDGDSDKTVYRALPLRTVVRLYPDLSLDSALRLLANYPILPVVSRANPNQLLGIITLEDVHSAYGIAAAKKETPAESA